MTMLITVCGEAPYQGFHQVRVSVNRATFSLIA